MSAFTEPVPDSVADDELRDYLQRLVATQNSRIVELETINQLFQPEDWHEVGAAGEPAFGTGWFNYTASPLFNTAAFFKDPFGVVHIKGLVVRPSGPSTLIFTLPAGYCPAKQEIMVADGTNVHNRIDIWEEGGIYIAAGDPSAYLSLDGITFRAAN
jgi:hypothetical protein